MKIKRLLMLGTLLCMAAGCDVPTDDVSYIIEKDTGCLLSQGFPLLKTQRKILQYVIECSKVVDWSEIDGLANLSDADQNRFYERFKQCGLDYRANWPVLQDVLKMMSILLENGIKSVSYRSDSIRTLSMLFPIVLAAMAILPVRVAIACAAKRSVIPVLRAREAWIL